jgi:osmotically-inducible protein OsmY
MKPNMTRVLLGAALVVFSTYAFAQTTANQSDDQRIIIDGSGLSDAQLRAEVMRQINDRPELRFHNIDVQSFQHNVYLYGVVDTGAESAEAEAVASGVPSVRKVYNGLALSNG